MKKYFFGVIISLSLSISATASEKTDFDKPDRAIYEKLCGSYSGFAHMAMSGRQEGVQMRSIISISVDDITRNIVIEAYSKPRMSSVEGKKRYIQDFENDVYLECIKKIAN